MTAAPGGAPEPPRAKRAGRIGRRIAIAFYLVALGYITLVGYVSVGRAVFFSDAAPADASVDCDAAIRTLHTELMALASAHVGGAGGAPDLDAWFTRWDARHQALDGRCDERNHRDLERLRFRIELTLRRWDREDGRLAERIGDRLRATQQDAPTPGETP